MPRIRSIKPEYFESPRLQKLLSIEAHFLFPRLWQEADPRGILKDEPDIIWSKCFSIRYAATGNDRYSPKAIVGYIEELCRADAEENRSFVMRYEVGGKRLLVIPGFKEHQKIPQADEWARLALKVADGSALPPPQKSLIPHWWDEILSGLLPDAYKKKERVKRTPSKPQGHHGGTIGAPQGRHSGTTEVPPGEHSGAPALGRGNREGEGEQGSGSGETEKGTEKEKEKSGDSAATSPPPPAAPAAPIIPPADIQSKENAGEADNSLPAEIDGEEVFVADAEDEPEDFLEASGLDDCSQIDAVEIPEKLVPTERIREFVQAEYQETAKTLGWVAGAGLNRKRLASLNARLRTTGWLRGVIAKLRQFRSEGCSDFLCGSSGSWRATFDWLLTERAHLKLVEGAWDKSPPKGVKSDAQIKSEKDEMMREYDLIQARKAAGL